MLKDSITCCRDNDKTKMEKLMLVCLRNEDSVRPTLEKVAERMLDRRKLIDWKVSFNVRTYRPIIVKSTH